MTIIVNSNCNDMGYHKKQAAILARISRLFR